MANIKHKGVYPVCKKDLPSGRFYCSDKCGKRGRLLGILVNTNSTRPKNSK